MWELSGTRAEMEGQMDLHRGEAAVRIMAKPSKKIFFMLLQKTSVKKIAMARGIAKTVPQNIYAGLAQAGVEVEIIQKRRGRKDKFGAEAKGRAVAAVADGMPLVDAMKKFGMSRRSYFYWKKKEGIGR